MGATWEFEPVAGPYGFTEGPVWDGNGVMFSDIPNSRIMRYEASTGECGTHRKGTNHANGLTLSHAGELFACEMGERRVARYDPDGTDVSVASEYNGSPLKSPNDLTFDSEGRLWFTDPFYDASWLAADHKPALTHRSVYRADPVGTDQWEITRMTDDTTNPNGLLVSGDGKWLYVAQTDLVDRRVMKLFVNWQHIPTITFRLGKHIPTTLRRDPGKNVELRRYPIEGDRLGDYEILHDFYPNRGIDGMCLDAEGNIVATAGI